MRFRKLSKLRFQFGHLAPDCTADEIAMALSHSGHIEVITREDGLQKYAETDLMRAIPKDRFEFEISKSITNFLSLRQRGES